jgi:peptidoglycan/xylan/chitin deacetylase (PgdA/CDA1 family)
MRATTRYFEIRACVLALLVYGLIAPLAGYPVVDRHAAIPPVAPDAGAVGAAGTSLLITPSGSVPAVVTGVEGAPSVRRTVALTFDDGPDPRWTPRVLDLLTSHRAVGTFCLVGENAVRRPDLVRAIVDAGMRLCDHTRVHAIDTSAPEAGMAHDDLVDLAGTDVPWFRAPGGVWSTDVQRVAGARGMHPLGWSVDSRDWTRPGSDEIVEQVQRHVHPGAVVLLHDGGGRRDQTVAALEELLPWLAAQCYVTTFPDGSG